MPIPTLSEWVSNIECITISQITMQTINSSDNRSCMNRHEMVRLGPMLMFNKLNRRQNDSCWKDGVIDRLVDHTASRFLQQTVNTSTSNKNWPPLGINTRYSPQNQDLSHIFSLLDNRWNTFDKYKLHWVQEVMSIAALEAWFPISTPFHLIQEYFQMYLQNDHAIWVIVLLFRTCKYQTFWPINWNILHLTGQTRIQ